MTDFDPEFDKLPDQPVTISGDKSAAAWHPNTGPEVLNADLSARLRGLEAGLRLTACDDDANAIADALAALGDTVPREQYADALANLRFGKSAFADAERERDEARAERDALAHVIEQVRNALGANYNDCTWWSWIEDGLGGPLHGDLKRILDTAPVVSLALHDAEVWDQGVRAKSASSSIFDADVFVQNPYRAEAK